MKESRGADKKMPISSSCKPFETIDGFVEPGQINDEIRKMVGKYKGGRGAENVAIQKNRGVIETDLVPDFIDGGICPEIDSEKWAIDYSHKRRKAALHKGIDIPQPRGTPIRAVAAGVVVTPKDGYFMDPNALYRLEPPYNSQSLVKLPKDQKKVSVPYIKADDTLVPAGTKRIWPYVCKE